LDACWHENESSYHQTGSLVESNIVNPGGIPMAAVCSAYSNIQTQMKIMKLFSVQQSFQQKIRWCLCPLPAAIEKIFYQ